MRLQKRKDRRKKHSFLTPAENPQHARKINPESDFEAAVFRDGIFPTFAALQGSARTSLVVTRQPSQYPWPTQP